MLSDVTDADKTFAESLLRMRTRADMSQSELARHMTDAGWTTYSQMTVSRTEKGERTVRLAEAIDLAAILRTRVETMAGLEPALLLHSELNAVGMEFEAIDVEFDKIWLRLRRARSELTRLRRLWQGTGVEDEHVERKFELLGADLRKLVASHAGYPANVAVDENGNWIPPSEGDIGDLVAQVHLSGVVNDRSGEPDDVFEAEVLRLFGEVPVGEHSATS